MKNMLLTDEIEIRQAFESMTLPEIDVSDSVISSIKSVNPRNMKKKRAFAIGLIAAALLLSTTAFAAVNRWILKDSNNNVVLTLQGPDEENQKPFNSSTDPDYQKIVSGLEPGKAIIYYDARQPKPENTHTSEILSVYCEPVKYTDLDTLTDDAGIYFAIPSSLPEGYAFSEGYIMFDSMPFDFNEILGKLKEDTMNSGKNIAAVEWETSSNERSIGMVYRNDRNEEIRVNIFILPGENLYTDDPRYSKSEKITLNGSEILYTEVKDLKEIIMRELQPGGQRTVKTFENGKVTETVINSYIHYTITSTDLTREEMLDIAESMIR